MKTRLGAALRNAPGGGRAAQHSGVRGATAAVRLDDARGRPPVPGSDGAICGRRFRLLTHGTPSLGGFFPAESNRARIVEVGRRSAELGGCPPCDDSWSRDARVAQRFGGQALVDFEVMGATRIDERDALSLGQGDDIFHGPVRTLVPAEGCAREHPAHEHGAAAGLFRSVGVFHVDHAHVAPGIVGCVAFSWSLSASSLQLERFRRARSPPAPPRARVPTSSRTIRPTRTECRSLHSRYRVRSFGVVGTPKELSIRVAIQNTLTSKYCQRIIE